MLLPLKVLLIGLDFMIMLVTFGWIGALKKLFTKEPTRSVPVNEDKPWHRVHAQFKDQLIDSPYDGVNTLYDLSKRSFEMHPTVKCMGSRKYLGQLNSKVKEFDREIVWRTFADVKKASIKFGAALKGCGCVSAPKTASLDQLTTPCSLAIFENTCPEWMMGALGAFSQGIIVTTIYATLGMDAVISAVNDGHISVILCNRRGVKALQARVAEMPTLKTIVYTNDLVAPDEKIDLGSGNATVISFEDFCASGDTSKYPPTPPTSETTAVIMYTSGSTGKPKGVVLTHRNALSMVGAAMKMLEVMPGEEVYLGYLPLAHILELTAELSMIATGSTICYADPKTLTTTGASPVGALEQYAPTVMAGVPKIWDVIAKGVKAKVAASSPVAQFLVNTAFEARAFAIEHGYDTPLFKALVFNKFSKVVGGRMTRALSGGGPLNKEVQVFCRTAFGFPLFQGYGLTETTAGLTIQDVHDLRAGIAGVPLPCCEVRLVSCPDVRDRAGLPYLMTDTKDVDGHAIFGRGEVQVKGYNVAKGYYMMPDKTKEEFGSDGWFATGDIGQFASDGSLQIVDRKKNLVKLKGGEYVAIEKMEGAYGNSQFCDAVSGGICCYGDGDMDRPVALMQLNKTVALQWAKHNGMADKNYEKEILPSRLLYDAVMADLHNEHKKGGLSHLEKLVAVSLLNDPWTPENGCLTAANKLDRRAVIKKFSKEFESVKEKGIF